MRTAGDKTAKKKSNPDYTRGGKIKILNSVYPSDRPEFEEWMKHLKTSQLVYLTDPEAKKRADGIMENVGIQIDCRTWWEILSGASIDESINYKPEVQRVLN
jgi:hypothetical protein